MKDFQKIFSHYGRRFSRTLQNHLAIQEASLTLGRFRESMGNHPEKNLNNVEEAGDRANKGDTLQEAIESYEKRLHIARDACDRAREAKAYYNLGLVYISHNDLPKAMECY